MCICTNCLFLLSQSSLFIWVSGLGLTLHVPILPFLIISVHKAHKEELECTLWILEQVLCLLPELIHKRWQLHSLGRILSKLLHSGNSVKLRRQAIRYFLMWYQALNDNAPDYVHNMFQTLVPGLNSPSLAPVQISGSVFHDTSAQNPVTPSELLPVLPPSGGEKAPEHQSKFFLEALLEHMVHTVIKLEWHDKGAHHHRCFHFLLEKFKVYYLMKICPSFSHETSLYTPNLGKIKRAVLVGFITWLSWCVF